MSLEPDRCCLVRADAQVGSGYRVSDSLVLTAAHVVRDRNEISVTVGPGEVTEHRSSADCVWERLSGGVDLAVLMLTDPPTQSVGSVEFGGVGDRAARLEASAVGYPRWKLRPDDGGSYRDSAHIEGRIPVFSNRRGRTLEFIVSPPGQDPDRARSPWAGMSGAAVWSEDRLIGVIAEHHRAEGLGRLTVMRLDAVLANIDHADRNRLAELIGLPTDPRALVEVPRSAADRVRMSYQATAAWIAPEQLFERDDELDDLVRFTASSEPIYWVQGGPWTGKSALVAWFVLHPPQGVATVSFFITRRFHGQADSNAYLDAVVEQLASVLSEPPPRLTPSSRTREYHRLIDQVRSRESPTVLVVDGLDEDDSTHAGLPTIASLLPRKVGPGLRLIVTSRPYPIPGDVPRDHLLHGATPVDLYQTPYAADIERQAKEELDRLLRSEGVEVELLGLITAAGAGLTLLDLTELAGEPKYRVQQTLGGRLGRTLDARRFNHNSELIYLFAHETLRDIALDQFGTDVERYRQKIYSWADGHARRGWNANTPRYLLRPYARMLETTCDLDRLAPLALDRDRHDLILRLTGSDFDALSEVAAVQTIYAAQSQPDLVTCTRLAAHRQTLERRSRFLPTGLAAVWAALGELDRAKRLANSIPERGNRDTALANLVTGALPHVMQTSDFAWVEQIARSITDSSTQAQALNEVAQVMAAHDIDRAEQIARSINDSSTQAQALNEVAQVVAAHDIDRAEQIARSINDSSIQAQALNEVAQVVAAHDIDRAEQIAGSITDLSAEARALSAVAQVVAAHDIDRARVLLEQAEQIARSINDSSAQAEALSEVAKVVAAHDVAPARVLLEQAEQIARSINDSYARAQTLNQVAQVVALHDANRAKQIARSITHPLVDADALGAVAKVVAARDSAHGEQIARSITDGFFQSFALAAVAEVVAGHDANRAEQIVRSMPQSATSVELIAAMSVNHDQALAAVAKVVAVHDLVQAERIARSITSFDPQLRALTGVVRVGAALDPEGAEGIARSITDPSAQAAALSEVAQVVAGHDAAQARRLIWEAEQIARSVTDAFDEAHALGAVAHVVAAHDVDRAWMLLEAAEQIARSSSHPIEQVRALQAVAQAVAAHDADRAEQIARSIIDPDDQELALEGVAQVVASHDAKRAEQIARSLHLPFDQVQTFMKLGRVVAAHDANRAEQIARSIASPNYQVMALNGVAEVVAVHDADRAEQIARSIKDPGDQAYALGLVALVVAAYDADRARVLVSAAEKIIDSLESSGSTTLPGARDVNLGAMAQVVAADDTERAEQIARSIHNPAARERALAAVAQVVAAHDVDRAEQIARSITDSEARDQTLGNMAQVVAAHDVDRAEQIARSITDPSTRAQALGRLARAVHTVDAGRGAQLLADALHGGEWIQLPVVEALTVVEPNALLTLADCLLDDATLSSRVHHPGSAELLQHVGRRPEPSWPDDPFHTA